MPQIHTMHSNMCEHIRLNKRMAIMAHVTAGSLFFLKCPLELRGWEQVDRVELKHSRLLIGIQELEEEPLVHFPPVTSLTQPREKLKLQLWVQTIKMLKADPREWRIPLFGVVKTWENRG